MVNERADTKQQSLAQLSSPALAVFICFLTLSFPLVSILRCTQEAGLSLLLDGLPLPLASCCVGRALVGD